MTYIGQIIRGQVVVPETVTLPEGMFVRIEPIEAEQPTTMETMRFVEQSGLLDFWNDDGEDVYSDRDGETL